MSFTVDDEDVDIHSLDSIIDSIYHAESNYNVRMFDNWMRTNANISLETTENNLTVGTLWYKFSKSHSIHFFDNWQMVYNCLIVNDSHDDFGGKAPSFKAALDFFFSRSMIIPQVLNTTFLVTFLVAICISMNTFYVDFITVAVVVLQFFSCWGCYIYRGAIFPQKLGTKYFKGKSSSQKGSNLTSWALLKQFVTLLIRSTPANFADEENMPSGSFIEMNPMSPTSAFVPEVDSPLRASPEIRKYLQSLDYPEDCDFYELLNVATKYMIYESLQQSVSERASSSFQFQRGYHDALRASFVFGVIYAVAIVLISGNRRFPSAAAEAVHQYYYLYCSYLLTVQMMWLSIVILVLFNGLYLSGEVGSKMCMSWLSRFSGLRKITMEVGEKDAEGGHCNDKSIGKHGHGDQSQTTETENGHFQSQRNFDDSETKESPSGSIARSPSDLSRTNLSHVPPASSTPAAVLESHSSDDHLEMSLQTLSLLSPYIRRDAYERYLFIQNFMQQSSTKWQAFLSALMVVTLAGLTYFYVTLALLIASGSVHKQIYTLCILVIFAGAPLIFIFSYPLSSLAFANIKVSRIRSIFSGACPDDFGPFGNMDDWASFMDANPLYWTIYSMPINKAFFQTYVSALAGVIPALVAVVAFIVTGNFNAL